MDTAAAVLLSMIAAATPLLFAATGELVTEKSGVLNLGVEGMMLVGAISGFAVAIGTGSWLLAIVAAAVAGVLLSLVFGYLTLTLLANQMATGLALTIFGIGLSALMGQGYVGTPLPAIPRLNIHGLSDLPLIGPVVFGQDALVYLSIAGVAGVATTALLAPSFGLVRRLRRLRLGWFRGVLLERHLQQLDQVAGEIELVRRVQDLAPLEHREALAHRPQLIVRRLVGPGRPRPRIVDAHDELHAAVRAALDP